MTAVIARLYAADPRWSSSGSVARLAASPTAFTSFSSSRTPASSASASRARRGVVVGSTREELDEARAARRGKQRHRDRGDELSRFERRLVVIAEEIFDRQLAPAAGPLDLHAGAERDERDGRVLIRVGVSERAADRGHVTDPDRPHAAKRLREDRQPQIGRAHV